jgi:hypothetical protein
VEGERLGLVGLNAALTPAVKWIEATALSRYVAENEWVVPSVQTIHILAIAAVCATALILHGRVLGLIERDVPVVRLAQKLLPIIWWAMPVLLITGILMIVGEPARALKNWIFQLKLVLIVAALGLTLVFQIRVQRHADYYVDGTSSLRRERLLIALPSLLLWLSVIFAGRWIAYL